MKKVTDNVLSNLKSAYRASDTGEGPCMLLANALRKYHQGESKEDVTRYLLRCGFSYNFVNEVGLPTVKDFDMPFELCSFDE